MQSILYTPGSNGSANASLMTVQTIRSAGATSIITNTVLGAPTKFYGSMGTPHTFTDPVTGEIITVISEATAVDFAGSILSGHVEIDAIAPGYVDGGSKVGDIIVIRPITEWANNLANILAQAHQDNGALKTTALDAFYKPSEITSMNLIALGGISATVSALTGSMSNIIYYISGIRYTKNTIANKVYTASKDTYVGIDAAGNVTYQEVANNAVSPAQTVGVIWLARVITGASAILYHDQHTIDTNGNFIYPAPTGTSRVFQLASNVPWRVNDIGQIREYYFATSWAGGSLPQNQTIGAVAVATPFTTAMGSNSFSQVSSFSGGYTDQTGVMTSASDIKTAWTPFIKNLYAGGALTFTSVKVMFKLTFASGAATF